MQAGPSGDRRTTISMLLDAGNPLATVSQWIGHASVGMTHAYWERDPASLLQSMHLPWLGPPPPPPPEGGGEESEGEVAEAFELLLEDRRRRRRRLLEEGQQSGGPE